MIIAAEAVEADEATEAAKAVDAAETIEGVVKDTSAEVSVEMVKAVEEEEDGVVPEGCVNSVDADAAIKAAEAELA